MVYWILNLYDSNLISLGMMMLLTAVFEPNKVLRFIKKGTPWYVYFMIAIVLICAGIYTKE